MSQAIGYGAQQGAKRILIIEDDAVVARLYQNRLRKEGYQVDIANEGQEGFFSILKDKPDGVLLDLMLPNMDGLQILKKTRAQKQFENIPIIVFSNSYINGMLDDAIGAGATRIFNKSDPSTTQNIVAGFGEIFFPSRSKAPAPQSVTATAPVAPDPAPVLETDDGSVIFQKPSPATSPQLPHTAPQLNRGRGPAFAAPTPRFGAIPTPKAPLLNANGAAQARSGTAPAPSMEPGTLRMAGAPQPKGSQPAPPQKPAHPHGHTIFLTKNAPLLPAVSKTPGPVMPPSDPALIPPSDDAAAMQEEFVKVFFEGGPETMSGIRKSLRGYSKEPSTSAGQAQLNGFYRKIHSLTGAAGMASLESIGNFSACLEAFLRELLLNPVAFQASTLRTLASAVDLLGLMFDQGPSYHCPVPSEPVVMVVDDDVISRRAVTFGLDKAHLKAFGTADPHHALEEMGNKPYELIFLDVDMPDMDGFELCSRIRHIPVYRNTPVVFITSMTDFQTRAKSITSGGNDFISKPLCFIELAVKALTFILKGRLTANAEPAKAQLL